MTPTVHELAAQGRTVAEIAAATGLHRTTVARQLRSPGAKPRGRPPQGRTVQVWTRLGEEEAQRMVAAADAAGVTAAEWLRRLVLAALGASTGSLTPGVDPEDERIVDALVHERATKRASRPL